MATNIRHIMVHHHGNNRMLAVLTLGFYVVRFIIKKSNYLNDFNIHLAFDIIQDLLFCCWCVWFCIFFVFIF
jgi:hypothetical protein